MRNKKKILIFSTQLMPTGGIENHLMEFLTQMSISSHLNIDIFILNTQLTDNDLGHIKNNTQASLLSKKEKSFIRWLKIGWFVCRSVFTKYDTLYTNGQGNSIYWIAKVFRFDKWVHHHHTSGDLSDQQTWPPRYVEALNIADVIIACSTKNALAMQTALKRTVLTIPCFSRSIDINEKKIRASQTEKVHLGYYGRLIPEKGIDLIAALSDDSETNDIQFHIWGEGKQFPPEYFKRHPNLHYHGSFGGKDELTDVLNLLDGYLLLSTHPEGLPISLLEVMSAGLPWLATNQGGISDIACDPTSTRLLNSVADFNTVKKEVLSLASAIKTGTIDREKQRSFYNTHFSCNVLVEQWKRILAPDNISA